MQQRRPLGLLISKAKVPSSSMSQLWHKGTLEDRLPKYPSRDLEIPSWPQEGVLWPSSTHPPWTHHWRLEVPRAPGPDSHHLYLTVAGMPIFVIERGTTYSAMPAYSRKTKVSHVSIMGVDSLISNPQITEPLPCTQPLHLPISPFFSHTPKMSHSYSWERPFLKVLSLCYYPKPTLWSSLAHINTLPITHPAPNLAYLFRTLNLTHSLLSTSNITLASDCWTCWSISSPIGSALPISMDKWTHIKHFCLSHI